MRIQSILLVSALLLSGTQAMARNFYFAQMQATVHFSQLDQLTDVVTENFTLDVRYSDDHDFCRVYVGKQDFGCQTYHPAGTPEIATITINREELGAMIAEVIKFERCAPPITEAWQRLAVYLSDTVDLEHQGMDFYQQIHDREPESFHLWLYELTEGKKY